MKEIITCKHIVGLKRNGLIKQRERAVICKVKNGRFVCG